MSEQSPIRRFVEGRDEVAGYYPNAPQRVVLSRDVLLGWRGLDASDWRAEGWPDVGALLEAGRSDEEFLHALEDVLSVAEIQVVESPPDYLTVAPV